MPILSRRQALRLPLIAVLGGMAHTTAASSAHAQATATVFADPSLKPALTSLIPAFRKETGAGLMFAYGDARGAVGSSDRLVHDVILLAGREAMAPFVPSGQVETPVDLATGGLALVAAPGLAEPVAVSRDMAWESWVSERRPLTVVDPEIDALGQRAMDALRSMGWGEGVSKSIHLAPSMRAVLDLVARGEAGLGVAHASAAAADGRVRVVGPLPPDTYPPVVYQVAIRQGVAADSPARAFVHFLYGDAGRRALRTAGVTPLVP